MLHGKKESLKSENLAKSTFKEDSTGEYLPSIKINKNILNSNIVELISFVAKNPKVFFGVTANKKNKKNKKIKSL